MRLPVFDAHQCRPGPRREVDEAIVSSSRSTHSRPFPAVSMRSSPITAFRSRSGPGTAAPSTPATALRMNATFGLVKQDTAPIAETPLEKRRQALQIADRSPQATSPVLQISLSARTPLFAPVKRRGLSAEISVSELPRAISSLRTAPTAGAIWKPWPEKPKA